MNQMKNEHAIETFIEARRLIAEIGWTQGAFARDTTDSAVPSNWDHATCFCALGAIHRAAYASLCGSAVAIAEKYLRRIVGPYAGLDVWNDESIRTKEDVVRFFDALIAHLQHTNQEQP